jgi:transcriptional regulator with XRE-family HTH domain
VDFGARIRTLRNHLGLSGEQFGARVGMTKSNVSMTERGERQVSAQLVDTICREFSVDPRFFFGGVDKPEDAIGEVTQTNTQSIIERLQSIEAKVAPGDVHDPVAYRVSVRRPLRDLVSKLADLDDEVLEKVDTMVYGYLQGRRDVQREEQAG